MEEAMKKSLSLFTFSLALISLLALSAYENKTQAQASQHPILDKVAEKVIQKYQQSSCEDLWKKKQENAPPSAEQQKAVAFLKSNPEMRTVFINKVAAPIANKMFECGMIP
jgi:hypothetical protein